MMIVVWCNGSTTGFGSVCRGSNPRTTTHNKRMYLNSRFRCILLLLYAYCYGNKDILRQGVSFCYLLLYSYCYGNKDILRQGVSFYYLLLYAYCYVCKDILRHRERAIWRYLTI